MNTSQTESISNEIKPRLILKVKLNSPITKRKRESDTHLINEKTIKRKKTQVIQTPIPLSTPISPMLFNETNSIIPRLKTTQQLLVEMQTQRSTEKDSNLKLVLY